jgi:hypothetical protein
MKFIVATGLSALFAAAMIVATGAETRRSPVFWCSIGEKRVSVSKSGDRFVYHFGTAAKDEMSIVGIPAAGNIFQMAQRFDGEEHQLRFRNGEFSYIVYSTSGNPIVGGRAIAGLVVKRGTDVVSDFACSRFTELNDLDHDYSSLPEDTAAFSAM